MIAQINGKVIQKSDKYIAVQTNGIGYLLYVTNDLLAKLDLGKEISLWTHLIVREDVLDLYGFETIDEKVFFEMLISVSGIGPRSALSILSLAPMETIKKAIASSDTSYLTKVSGIGKKTAEKIVIELRDKLASLGHSDSTGVLRGESDVIEALQALGYSLNDARNAIKEIPETITNTNDRIKEALKILGK